MIALPSELDAAELSASTPARTTKLKLEIREDQDGKKYLHFPFRSISDIHWGTKQSRAKRLCSMLEHSRADHEQLDGDIIDGERLMKKKTWNMGPWHRQGLAHMLRKSDEGSAVIMNPGNHESGMQSEPIMVDGELRAHRRLQGKHLFGVKIEDQTVYRDPKGRLILISHGHEHDAELFKDAKSQTRWYRVGDFALARLYNLDSVYRTLKPNADFSFAAGGKHLTKDFINKKLGVRKILQDAIDASPYDGYLYGHTHMAGFDETPDGKMVINDGTCTEHVQAVVHDADGNWAILTWHKDRLDIEEPGGATETIYWKDLGLDHFSEAPTMYDDEHTNNADRVLRLTARMWPAKDRQKALKKLKKASAALAADPDNLTLQFKYQQARNHKGREISIPKHKDISREYAVHEQVLEASAA